MAIGSRPMRWLLRGALLLIAAAGLIVGVLALWIWLSRPQLDGDLDLRGLTQNVEVTRDSLGVVAITAGNRLDAMQALGFLHAQERYFEMDLARRRAAGALSALFGAAALPLDRAVRPHALQQAAAQVWAAEPPERQAIVTAYTRGVNQGLEALPVRPWAYVLLRQQPQPWQETDSILVLMSMFLNLNDSTGQRELGLSQMAEALTPAAYAFLVRTGTEWDAPLIGDAWPEPPVPGPELLDLRRFDKALFEQAPALAPGIVLGSNQFAVAGRFSRSGLALLANDMHLSLGAPGIWFRAQWQYPDSNAPDGTRKLAGATLPGTPGLTVGSNQSSAWGYTNSYVDPGDWIVLAPGSDPEHYLSARGEEAITERVEKLAIAGGGEESLVVRTTRFGPIMRRDQRGRDWVYRFIAQSPVAPEPILADQGLLEQGLAEQGLLEQGLAEQGLEQGLAEHGLAEQGLDEQGLEHGLAEQGLAEQGLVGQGLDEQGLVGQGLVGQGLVGQGLVDLGMLDLELADSVDAALSVARRSGVPPMNFMVAGRDGRIAWTLTGRFPERSCRVSQQCTGLYGSYDPALPVDSRQLDEVWSRVIPAAELPMILEPEQGRLFTANQRVIDAEGVRRFGDGGYALGARAAAIREGLQVQDPFDEASLLKLQLDNRSYLLDRWAALMRQCNARTALPQREQIAALLSNWQGRAEVDSAAYRLVRDFRFAVHAKFTAALAVPMVAMHADFKWPTLGQMEGVVWQLLEERPVHLLDPRLVSYDALVDAALQAVVEDAISKSGSLSAHTWGEANRSRIQHPLARALPLLGPWLNMPSLALPGDQNMVRVQAPAFGASQRMVVSPGLESEGIFHMPGGQSGHPFSPYYGAGHDAWAHGVRTPLLAGTPEHRMRFLAPVP